MNDPVEVELNTIEPNWMIAARVWWSWQWRVLALTLAQSLFSNTWGGILGEAIGLSVRGQLIFIQGTTYLASILIGLYFFKDILDRNFGKFRVCVIPQTQAENKPGLGLSN